MYDFSHPLLQETLYSELGLARTRTLHGAIAEALERCTATAPMAHAGELAFHYARGDDAASRVEGGAVSPRRRTRRVGEVRES